jgi:hypothetical protein
MRRGAVLTIVAIGALAAPVLAFGTGGTVQLHLRTEKAGPALGITWAVDNSSVLTRLDPSTLLPTGARRLTFLTSLAPTWAYSPDRSRLVLSNESSRLLVVDTRTLRLTASVRKPAFNDVLALAWIGGRVLTVMAGFDVPQLFVVDPRGGRVAAWDMALPGQFVGRAGRTAHQLVFLLAPVTGIGTCTLATADAAGTVRTVTLPDVRCGADDVGEDGSAPPAVEHEAFPGLAVDAAGNRAFVLPGGSTVTEVNLETMAVSAHDLVQPSSELDGLLGRLAPEAQAKGAPDGPWRQALWLGGGVLAVWGSDLHGSIDASGNPQFDATPAGITLVDTRSWTTRVLDAQGSDLQRDGDVLLGTAGTGGVTVYGADGSERFHLFNGRSVWLQAGFGRATVSPAGTSHHYWVVDPSNGTVVKTVRSGSPPLLLAAAASP